MSPSRAWLLIALAGGFEVAWAMALKASDGLTRPAPTAVFAVAMLVSVVLLARGLTVLPVGSGYAVWTGIGAVGTAILGIVFLGESRSALRLLFIAMIVAGIIGLRVVEGE